MKKNKSKRASAKTSTRPRRVDSPLEVLRKFRAGHKAVEPTPLLPPAHGGGWIPTASIGIARSSEARASVLIADDAD
jgi:hypothetical protein